MNFMPPRYGELVPLICLKCHKHFVGPNPTGDRSFEDLLKKRKKSWKGSKPEGQKTNKRLVFPLILRYNIIDKFISIMCEYEEGGHFYGIRN